MSPVRPLVWDSWQGAKVLIGGPGGGSSDASLSSEVDDETTLREAEEERDLEEEANELRDLEEVHLSSSPN